MNIKLRQLAHAQALFLHGSFRRAAEAEHISQPALSRSIQSLEESLGVLLFDRQAGEISPTAFGKALLSRTETILAETAELERELMLLQGLDLGRLDVAMGLYTAELSGAPALAELLDDHPQLQINARVRHPGELEQLVLAREVDLALGEISHLLGLPDLRVDPVGRHELLFFCRPGHPILVQRGISTADLDAFTLVSAPVRAPIARILPRNLRVDPLTGYARPLVQVDDLTAARVVIARTDGIGFATPIQLEPLLRRGEVEVIPFRASWLRLDYGFVYLASRSLSPAAEAFMGKVREIERGLADKNRMMVDALVGGVRLELEPHF